MEPFEESVSLEQLRKSFADCKNEILEIERQRENLKLNLIPEKRNVPSSVRTSSFSTVDTMIVPTWMPVTMVVAVTAAFVVSKSM